MFLLLLLVLCPGGSEGAGWAPSNLPVVMLRIDDVAVRSCEAMSTAVIDAVLAKNTPINVGVIASDLDKTTHSDFADYIKSISDNSLAEIVSHSYSHQTYTDNDLNWQIDDMNSAQDVLSGVTGVLPTAFIPPLNTFDSDTLEAMLDVDSLKVFSAECIWNQDIFGQVTSCPAPGAVTAPNILTGGNYHLPAGAVLGGLDYWDNKIQPGNLSEAIKWIDTQILNQNFSVVLLHPYEFSTSTECVTVDSDKIAVLESLIDYGVGKYQFMTFKDAAVYFTNDTSIFNPQQERDDAKFEFQAKLNIFIVFCFTGCVLLVACCSFCRTSTEQKIQKKDRLAAEMKRKHEIDSKLKTQRKQRDIELTTNPGNPAMSPKNKDKKKLNKANSYSEL